MYVCVRVVLKDHSLLFSLPFFNLPFFSSFSFFFTPVKRGRGMRVRKRKKEREWWQLWLLLITFLLASCLTGPSLCTIEQYKNTRKESEGGDGTSDDDGGVHKRSQQQQHQLTERRIRTLGSNKEQQRWSHVKISFDNESVRLEAADPTSASGTQLQPIQQPPTVVPPTIKIIGKEVRSVWVCVLWHWVALSSNLLLFLLLREVFEKKDVTASAGHSLKTLKDCRYHVTHLAVGATLYRSNLNSTDRVKAQMMAVSPRRLGRAGVDGWRDAMSLPFGHGPILHHQRR